MKSNADKLYSIKSVYPGIYLIEFKDDYNMAMHCLRYQEFYESPSSKFKGKSFTIFDYMEWYFYNTMYGDKSEAFKNIVLQNVEDFDKTYNNLIYTI